MLQVTLCFSKRYLTLDTWSSGQKTMLRIFQVITLAGYSHSCPQEGDDHFWLRMNHSPPRGTMILNRWHLGKSNYLPPQGHHLEWGAGGLQVQYTSARQLWSAGTRTTPCCAGPPSASGWTSTCAG